MAVATLNLREFERVVLFLELEASARLPDALQRFSYVLRTTYAKRFDTLLLVRLTLLLSRNKRRTNIRTLFTLHCAAC